jgi:hypothetical protein
VLAGHSQLWFFSLIFYSILFVQLWYYMWSRCKNKKWSVLASSVQNLVEHSTTQMNWMELRIANDTEQIKLFLSILIWSVKYPKVFLRSTTIWLEKYNYWSQKSTIVRWHKNAEKYNSGIQGEVEVSLLPATRPGSTSSVSIATERCTNWWAPRTTLMISLCWQWRAVVQGGAASAAAAFVGRLWTPFGWSIFLYVYLYLVFSVGSTGTQQNKCNCSIKRG